MSDVDGVLRRARHLVARLHARREDIAAVEAAGTGVRHGTEDAVIGAAAAQMPRQRRADFLARGHGGSLGRAPGIAKRHSLDDEARRAEAALQRVVRHERLLHRMQSCAPMPSTVVTVLVRSRSCRHQAAHGGLAVDQHGAGAADAGPADELGAGEIERVAHDVDQQRIGIVGEGSELAVDRHRAHLRSPDLREVDRGMLSCWLRRGGARLRCRAHGARDQHAQHDFQILQEGIGRLHRGVGGFRAVDRHLDAACKLARCHAGAQRQALLAADARNGRGKLLGIQGGVFLVEVARLQEMFGEQFLDMGRAVERSGQLPEFRADRRDQNIGKAAALFLGSGGRRDLGGERVLMQPFDDGAEQRFLGLEMMVERLPRQAGGLRRLLDRRTPETLPAEHQHRGIENAGTWAHLTILTKLEEMSNNEIANRDQSAVDIARPDLTDRTALYVSGSRTGRSRRRLRCLR